MPRVLSRIIRELWHIPTLSKVTVRVKRETRQEDFNEILQEIALYRSVRTSCKTSMRCIRHQNKVNRVFR